jgi:hypothetical protein
MSAVLRRLWWLDPGWLFTAIVAGTFLPAALQGSNAYRLYGTPKFIEAKHVLLAAAAIAVFVLGRWIAAATGRVPRGTPPESDRIVRIWFWITTGLTLFGYMVWIAVGVKNGFSLGMLRGLLMTDDPLLADTVHEQVFVNIKGVTTCTQFGVAAVPLGLWLVFRGRRQLLWPLALIVALAAGRALIFSERLALIELAVPAAVIVLRACVMGRQLGPLVRAGLQMAPALGVVGLVLFFGSFEYFRSWRHYQHYFDSYAEFTLWRVGGYYTTAHNNGAMALEKQKPYAIPFATLRQLWTFPGLSNTPFAYEKLTGNDPIAQYKEMLVRHGTPELNNEGGLFQPVLDYGIAGYLVFWCGCGFVAGRLYRGFLVGTLAGLLLYPLVFLGMLETPRLLYLCYTRSFPALATLLVVIWFSRPAPQTSPVASRLPVVA